MLMHERPVELCVSPLRITIIIIIIMIIIVITSKIIVIILVVAAVVFTQAYILYGLSCLL